MASSRAGASQAMDLSSASLSTLRRDSVLEPFNQFKHTPLKHVAKEIRVCDLLPAKDEDAPIVFNLRAIPLSRIEDTTCVSYVWGKEDEAVAMSLDGCWHRITQNLHALLLRLRTLGLHQDLWIDALCINQSDLAEKTEQVRMMDEIYSGAKNVIVVLDSSGPTIPASPDYVKAALEGLMGNQHLHELPCFNDPTAGRVLKELLQSQWFNRAWTVQEIVLSKRAVILYPHGLLPWSTLTRALRNWESHRSDSCCSEFLKSIESTLDQSCYSAYDAVECIARTQYNMDQSQGQHLLTALITFERLSVSNKVDKAFAFYSLHTAAGSPPPADYNKDLISAFIELAPWLLRTWGDLLPLCLEMESDLELPTWVPPFSSFAPFDGNYWKLRLSCVTLFDCARHIPWTFRYVFPKTLALPGVCLDQIEAFSEAATGFDSWERHSELLSGWLRFYQGRTSASTTAGDEAFAMLLVAGCTEDEEGNPRRVNAGDTRVWRSFVNCLIRDGAPKDGIFPPELMRCHLAGIYNRRLFRTVAGRYGVGPQRMKKMDSIWILSGGRLPFILRFSTDGPSMWPTYTLVGHAYLHGCSMDGEILRPGSRTEMCHLV